MIEQIINQFALSFRVKEHSQTYDLALQKYCVKMAALAFKDDISNLSNHNHSIELEFEMIILKTWHYISLT